MNGKFCGYSELFIHIVQVIARGRGFWGLQSKISSYVPGPDILGVNRNLKKTLHFINFGSHNRFYGF